MKTKKTIVTALMFAPIVAIAQSKHENKKDSLNNARQTVNRSRIYTFDQLDQRKIFHWANGQRSTATGREAGEHLSNYVMLIGDDSAVVVKGPVKDR